MNREGEASRGYQDTSEWREEEIRIAGNRVVEATDAVVEKPFTLFVGTDSFNESIIEPLEIFRMSFIAFTLDIQATSSVRGI